MGTHPEWALFYQSLNRLGPKLLDGLHPDLVEWVKIEGSEADAFFSDALYEYHSEWKNGNPTNAVKLALSAWTHNVKRHLYGVFGPDSLFPFDDFKIPNKKRTEWVRSIEGISILDSNDKIQYFIDSVLIGVGNESNSPKLLLQAVVQPYASSQDGDYIHAITLPWRAITKELSNNWDKAYQIQPHKWEELIAASFDHAGYDEVILTPRSNDHGRDVIAIKKGIGTIKIINSVKAYKPDFKVSYDHIRALAGVLHGDLSASKGILMTTSDFPPNVLQDSFLKPLIPFRLELLNGVGLKKWLEDLSQK